MANATSTQLQELYVAYFGRAADPTGLDYWTETGITTAAFAANMYAQPEFENEYGSKSVANQVNQIYKNLFDREADVDGLTYWTQQINLGVLELAEIAVHLVYAAQNNEGSEEDKTALTNRTNAAIAYTATVKESAAAILAFTPLTEDPYVAGDNITEAKNYLAGIDKDTTYTSAGITTSVNTIIANGLPAKAATHNLTVGIDDLDGGDGKDTFNAALSDSVMTLSSTDTIDGGSGVDSLNATISGTGTYSPTFTAIENLYPTLTAAGTFSLEKITGVTLLQDTNSTANTIYSNIPNTSIKLGASGNTGNTTFKYTTAAVAGDSDSVSLALSSSAGTTTIAGVETLNISSTGGATTLTALTVADTTTINVTGDQDLTLGTLSAKVATIDGSAFTGGLTADGTNTTANTITGGSGNDVLTGQASADDVLTGGAGNDTLTPGTGDNTLSGGAGNDTFVMAGGLTVADTITGGDGTDTVTITAGVAVADGANVSGVEVLEIALATATNAITQDLDAFEGVTAITIGDTSDENVTLNDVAASTSLKITAASSGISVYSLKSDTSADTAAVTMGTSTAAAGTAAALTISEIETLSFHSQGGANIITTLTAADATSITVTGDEAFTITQPLPSGSVSVATVDASAATANVDVDLDNNTVDATMTGGVGNDTLEGGTTNDTITGGTGNDTLIGNEGIDALTGGAGNDSLDGGAGNDTLAGGDGNDTITAGAGNDTITGGAGNDTINFTTAATAEITSDDSIDGGDGTDTLVIVSAADLSGTTKPTATNVEKVNYTFESGITKFDTSGVASLTDFIVDSLTDDAAYAINNLADGATVQLEVETTAAAVTYDTAGTTLTLHTKGNTATTATISDAVTLNITAGAAATNDISALVLDDDVTTTLTLTGSTTDGSDLLTGNITKTNLLSSITASSTNTGGLITVGTVADGDALTSIVIDADKGNISFSDIAGSGSAEGLATITLTANNGATATLSTTTADTTDSTTDLAQTITGTAKTASSTVAIGTVTNTYGTITAVTSGLGTVGSTALSAEHIDLTHSAGTASTFGTLTSTDDFVANVSGATLTTFTTITITDDATVTVTGAGGLTIGTVTNGIGDFTLDGSASTGVITVTTNSATSTTEAHILTGGSNNDDLAGGAAADTITGGAGNDNLEGGGGNDTIKGGDGNDTLTAGTGTVTLEGGAGNDTLVLGTTHTSSDSYDGGAGTDTATLDVTTTIAPTLTNVEKATVGFTTGGAFNSGNSSSLTQITIEEAADGIAATATVININDGTQVIVTDSDIASDSNISTVVVDSVAGADATITARIATGSALTVTDVAGITLNAESTGAAASFNNTVLDDADTTSITVTGADGAYAFSTGAVTGTNKVATITGSTSTASGTATLTSMADADALTSINITATNANFLTGAIGSGGDAASLATVTLAATGGATVTLGDTNADDTTTDNAQTTTITLTADTSSTARLMSFSAADGAINLTATGAGNFTLGDEDADPISYGENSTFDLSSATGTNVINTLGAAAGTVATITLASEGGSDTIQVDITGSRTIANFQTGTGGDVLDIDDSLWGTLITGTAAAPASTGRGLEEFSAAEALDANDDLIVLVDAAYATKELVLTALEANGTRSVGFATDVTAGDDLAVVWSDGSNSYLGHLNIATAINISIANAIAVTDGTMTVVAELTGVDVSTSGTFTAANFDLFA